ncbi:MAG: hypothetical protein Q8P44_03705 [Dehalococcoidia bacterium]|nr:hypothetical protein [Dehalococcoidia bacterium]
MGSLKPFHNQLKHLQDKARNLTATGLALNNLFAEEAKRLEQWDEASRLETLCFSLKQEMEREKNGEDAERYGHSQYDLMVSLGGLAIGGLIKATSKNKQLSAYGDYLLKNPGNKKRPFGLVLIRIGPKGLPDDMGVVSISRWARESKRDESEVIGEIREGGCLLLDEDTFSRLINKLADDIREGRRRLPISLKELARGTTSGSLNMESAASK